MELKKGRIEDKIYNVISHQEYAKNKDLYDPVFTAIEDKNGLVYPIRTGTRPNRPGFYDQGVFGYFKEPELEERDIYSANNIIDFNTNDTRELIEKSAALKNMEREILTSPDNIFQPKISPEDEPLLEGLKAAITEKNIDISKYKPRFGKDGKDYANDLKVFKGSKITYKMFDSYMNILDLKATLIIEDRSPDVANPMNKPIIINLSKEDDMNE